MSYQERKIEVGSKSVNCQILNWQTGKPPKYLVCNPIDKNYPEYNQEFIAEQRMGAWMKADLCRVLESLGNHDTQQETYQTEESPLPTTFRQTYRIYGGFRMDLPRTYPNSKNVFVEWNVHGHFLGKFAELENEVKCLSTDRKGYDNLSDFEMMKAKLERKDA